MAEKIFQILENGEDFNLETIKYIQENPINQDNLYSLIKESYINNIELFEYLKTLVTEKVPIPIWIKPLAQNDIEIQSSMNEDIPIQYIKEVLETFQGKYLYGYFDSDLFLLRQQIKSFRENGPIYGECNHEMFECNCYSINESMEDNELNYWFNGRCDFCGRIILNKKYCIRMPDFYSGWIGCYCSIDCLNDYNPFNPQIQTTEEYIAQQTLIDVTCKRINIIGIKKPI